MILPLAIRRERGFMAHRRVSIVDATERVIAQSVRCSEAEAIVQVINSGVGPAHSATTSGDVDHGGDQASRPPRG